MPRKLEPAEAKQKAARFCAFQERSPKEVSDKLRTWGLGDKDADEVLSDLLKEGFVDPQRFANAYCNDKFEFNSWGKQKIKASIYQHQLGADIVEQALDRIDKGKYFLRLQELTTKKWSSLESEELSKRKQKTLAFLVSKGFETDLIWKVLSDLERREDS